VPDAIKDRIRRGSALDGELYDFASNLFLAELERYGPAPEYHLIEQTEPPVEPFSADRTVSLPDSIPAPIAVPKGWFGAWSRSLSRLWTLPK
jgi:hypothetical protein